MKKVKAGRNKTIDTSIIEGKEYLDRCISIESPQSSVNNLLDKTIIGDMFDTVSLIPNNSIDLIIVDPPYNLTKSYHGTTFSKKSELDYEEYTRNWLSIVVPLLKDKIGRAHV